MAANNSTSITIETRCGSVRLRKRGNLWYARKQRNGERHEFALKTVDINIAIDRAQSLVPEMIIGEKQFPQDGKSIVDDSDYQRTFLSAKKRARAKGIEFNLTDTNIAELIKTSRGRCSLTGIPFSMARHANTYRAPFAPSLDRLNSTEGYTVANTRLVCVAVNWALSDWGCGVFETIAAGYISTLLRETRYVKNGAN